MTFQQPNFLGDLVITLLLFGVGIYFVSAGAPIFGSIILVICVLALFNILMG
jgi:hypothetical protein